MSSNPYFERAEDSLPHADFDQPATTSVALATLAVAYELRTANLIAALPHLPHTTQSRVKVQLYGRLALVPEGPS